MRSEPVTGAGLIFDLNTERPQQTATRWTLAALSVAVLHGGMVYALLYRSSEALAAVEPPAAVTIELAPVPVAPEAPALGPQMEMSRATTPSEQQDRPIKEEGPERDVQPETETDIPVLPENQTSEATLTQSAPSSPEPREKLKEEPRKPDKQKAVKRKPQDRSTRNAPATAAPHAALDAPRSATNVPAMAGTSSSVSPATWRSQIMALLNRHKRFPSSSGRGTSTVAFTIDLSGRVLSVRLARSSGDMALDQEAVALAHRVSPLPAPPAGIGSGGNILLAVPIRFGEQM